MDELIDGQEYRIVKLFYQPVELAYRLVDLDWTVTVRTVAQYFLFGPGTVGDART